MALLPTTIIEQNFLSRKNADLWKKLSERYKISVDDGFNYYELDYNASTPSVVIRTTKRYQESLFTHELLHLNLRNIGLDTASYFQSFNTKIYRMAALTICNCVEHILFFDDFVDLGYSPISFVMDYNNQEYDLNTLKTLFKNVEGDRDKSVLKLMVFYAFWTLKNEEYMGVNRDESLNWLQKNYSLFFSSCEQMFDNIIDFDLESKNIEESFNDLMSKYLRRNY